jgi:hypothetical protein
LIGSFKKINHFTITYKALKNLGKEARIPKAPFERLNSFLFEIVSRAPNSLLLFMFFPRSD